MRLRNITAAAFEFIYIQTFLWYNKSDALAQMHDLNRRALRQICVLINLPLHRVHLAHLWLTNGSPNTFTYMALRAEPHCSPRPLCEASSPKRAARSTRIPQRRQPMRARVFHWWNRTPRLGHRNKNSNPLSICVAMVNPLQMRRQ